MKRSEVTEVKSKMDLFAILYTGPRKLKMKIKIKGNRIQLIEIVGSLLVIIAINRTNLI